MRIFCNPRIEISDLLYKDTNPDFPRETIDRQHRRAARRPTSKALFEIVPFSFEFVSDWGFVPDKRGVHGILPLRVMIHANRSQVCFRRSLRYVLPLAAESDPEYVTSGTSSPQPAATQIAEPDEHFGLY